ncbi:hypothetical protein EUTSA_v10022342mg [Eutrema salsugineum]|uniref:Uncharacterized protein n=1 Tax=Eutrema salsugineum TaxID=72664 RepID=V4M2G0_EUTSA|nr:uncharacterized protein LOC18023771 [Eutrema salsugineum]ESQ48987.1 hypothetical protein EUTSA_v10022342mg [Eutrema salsugineum]
MKKITKKLSTKYVKLHKCRLRQDGSMKSEENDGELFREKNHLPEINEESNETTKETPKVTKIMESMHRKLMLKEKVPKKDIHVDGYDQSQMAERSVRNGVRDRKDMHQHEGSVRNHMNRDGMDQLVGSVRNGHMDHLEDLIRGRDRTDHLEGSIRNGTRDHRADQLEGSSKNGQKSQREDMTPKTNGQVDKPEGPTKSPSDFASKKDYLDWIEYVEGSSHHCFDRSENSEKPYRKDDIEHDQISVGISEGSIEGSNDEILLLKSSKYRKNEKIEDSKGYKKGKASKVKDSLKNHMVD